MGSKKYLHDVAGTIAGQIGLSRQESSVTLEVELYTRREDLRGALKGWSYERKGKLAGSHNPKKLDELAVDALVSAITTNVEAKLAKEPRIASIEEDGYRVEVVRVDFKEWEGVDLRIILTRLADGQWTTRDFSIDKDDKFLIAAGICRRGENFLSTDKKRLAELILGTFTVAEYAPEEGHHHLYVLDNIMLGDWCMGDLQMGLE